AARIYLTGGSSAVLLEWRASTIDIDLEIRPESEEILRSIPQLKEELEINVELASPAHFIPELPGWEERSRFILREGRIDYFHYDFYAQALSKIERSHARDVEDVRAMRERGLIDPATLMELYAAIEPQLFRYPAVDPRSFRAAVETFGPGTG
ncbi:MAG TPA: DUF6036 family nucleotidyltransferase, partial [Thermoanaerobaculia bacterium]|nr:DUF6036 family nucleotidyltransferase [Thermoanaerobaculia bacterium]